MTPGELRVIDDVRTELAPFLRDAILDRAARLPALGGNNINGWKSNTDFLDWPEIEIQTLKLELVERLGAVPVAWAMVNRNGSYHKRHRHGLTYQCGVYYVTAGDPAIATVFETPSAGHAQHETAVVPKPGRLVLFSGGTWHSVPKYDGGEPRITIALEVRP